MSSKTREDLPTFSWGEWGGGRGRDTGERDSERETFVHTNTALPLQCCNNDRVFGCVPEMTWLTKRPSFPGAAHRDWEGHARALRPLRPAWSTPYPKPHETRKPKPETRNSKPENRNPKTFGGARKWCRPLSFPLSLPLSLSRSIRRWDLILHGSRLSCADCHFCLNPCGRRGSNVNGDQLLTRIKCRRHGQDDDAGRGDPPAGEDLSAK